MSTTTVHVELNETEAVIVEELLELVLIIMLRNPARRADPKASEEIKTIQYKIRSARIG